MHDNGWFLGRKSFFGLILNQNYPELGASPDGVSDKFVFDVKCPSTEDNVKNYYCDGQFVKKFKAQI